MKHLQALQKIADEHGGNRASGTSGYDASVDYVVGVLRRAGFTELTIQPTEVVFEVESPDVHWQIVSDMSAPVEQAKATLSVADVQRLKRAMADAIEPYRVGHRIRLPNTALCISGRR